MKSLGWLVLNMVLVLAGCDKMAPRETFQDCVLAKVSAASSPSVAHILREACAKKHQVEMPPSALANIEGRLGQSVIQLNNRNSDWILTEVEFYVSPNPLIPQEPYLQTIYIEPLRKDVFFHSVDDDQKKGNVNYSWGILKAWGVPVKR